MNKKTPRSLWMVNHFFKQILKKKLTLMYKKLWMVIFLGGKMLLYPIHYLGKNGLAQNFLFN